MSGLSKSRVILYVVGVFVLGALAGGFAGYSTGKQQSFRPPKSEEMAARIQRKMTERLKLSPEQSAAILPFIKKDCETIDQVQKECSSRINDVINASRKDIIAILTPEQRLELDAMDKERNSRMSRHSGSRH